MRIIKLDTTIAKIAKVELWEGETLLAKTEATNPLSAIQTVLKGKQSELSEIDHFESNPGPGSFTGVRVGAAVANTLNWVLGKKHKLIEPIYD